VQGLRMCLRSVPCHDKHARMRRAPGGTGWHPAAAASAASASRPRWTKRSASSSAAASACARPDVAAASRKSMASTCGAPAPASASEAGACAMPAARYGLGSRGPRRAPCCAGHRRSVAAGACTLCAHVSVGAGCEQHTQRRAQVINDLRRERSSAASVLQWVQTGTTAAQASAHSEPKARHTYTHTKQASFAP